jgi:hypothetical protein
MGIGADTDFDAEELAMLEALRKDEEQQAAVPAAAAPAAAPAATAQPSEQPAVTEQQQQTATPAEPAAAAPAAPAQPIEAPQGDPRAALRASRRAERQARERAEQLAAELAELRKQVPQQQVPASVDGITDQELAEMEQDFPAQAKLVRANRELQKQLQQVVASQAQQPAQAAQPEFMPPALPPDLQEVVDDIPALLAWQCNPDQTAFEMAKATDAALMVHPVWKDKPVAERFAEVTRRVQAELGAAPAPQPSQQQQPAATPAQVLASVPRQAPSTLSDIGAGGTGVENPLTLDRMARMSDEDILAELARLG